MRITTLNTKLTLSANHLVFNIDKAPDPEIKIETLGWTNLKVSIKDGLLHVVKPDTARIDNLVLLDAANKITAAEAEFAKAKREAAQARERLLRDISLDIGFPLDTERR